ncbi:MAG: hypothetical protein IH614_13430 [Desulfuromonadales bacterium]|nr:hypothetical protein [Desulfuromonadales bacterium]
MENFQTILFPSILAVVGWLIKNYIFGLITKRNEIAHREFEYRLKEIFTPLYYYTGKILFERDSNTGDDIVARQLDILLSKAAYIIPKRHFHTIVKLVETNCSQNTSSISENDYINTRQFLYGQIEILNFILYSGPEFDIRVKTHLFQSYKYLIRYILTGIYHILVWAIIVMLIAILTMFFVEGRIVILTIISALIVLFLMLIVVVDARKRDQIVSGIQTRGM